MSFTQELAIRFFTGPSTYKVCTCIQVCEKHEGICMYKLKSGNESHCKWYIQ